MTKTQLRKKYKSMLRDVHKGLNKSLEKAIRSGAIDIKSAEDNYRLPKNILCAALREEERKYSPPRPNRAQKIVINNIYKMI